MGEENYRKGCCCEMEAEATVAETQHQVLSIKPALGCLILLFPPWFTAESSIQYNTFSSEEVTPERIYSA